MNSEHKNDIMVLKTDCYHCPHNLWIGAVKKQLSKFLDDMLAHDFSAIDFCYRALENFHAFLDTVHKECSLSTHCSKGCSNQFMHWLLLIHPGALLFPVLHTMGLRQDMVTECTAVVYGIGGIT